MNSLPKHELDQALMLALHDFQWRPDTDLAQFDLAENVGVTPQSISICQTWRQGEYGMSWRYRYCRCAAD